MTANICVLFHTALNRNYLPHSPALQMWRLRSLKIVNFLVLYNWQLTKVGPLKAWPSDSNITLFPLNHVASRNKLQDRQRGN